MTESIVLGDVCIAVTRKAVKNVPLSVHPPLGRVTLVAPTATRLKVARAYAISKLGWIREQQTQLLAQTRETPRQSITRETHTLWGAALSIGDNHPGREARRGTRPSAHHAHRAPRQHAGAAASGDGCVAPHTAAPGAAYLDCTVGDVPRRAAARLFFPAYENQMGRL